MKLVTQVLATYLAPLTVALLDPDLASLVFPVAFGVALYLVYSSPCQTEP